MIRFGCLAVVFFCIPIFIKGQVTLVPFASGFNRVTDIRHAGDERIFIVEQVGRIRILNQDGSFRPTEFLNIISKVSSNGEQGLLGLAFSPAFQTDRCFYVNYIGVNGHTYISRFKVSESNPDSAMISSEEVLLFILQPYSNHNGGCLQFGNDGFLYCALGDGGAGGDPGNRAQNPLDTLGKILRINVNVQSGFQVPTSNPYYGNPDTLNLIWAMGLRNPWRFSFDHIGGTIWIGDVGQGLYEEVNVATQAQAGLNYGWRCYEGNHAYNSTGCIPPYTFPVYEYPHSGLNAGCSVTGGYVYRGALYNSMFGKYFFTDYCSDNIYSLAESDTGYTLTLENDFSGQGFGSFGEDVYGTMYAGGNSSGNVFKMISNDCRPAAFITLEKSVKSCDGTAELKALYHPSLRYQWYRNGIPVAGATGHILKTDISGNYSVEVFRDSCSSVSPSVFLDRCVNATAPVVVAPVPVSGSLGLLVNSASDRIAGIIITDLTGKRVFNTSLQLFAGAQRYELQLPFLASGIYFLELKNEEINAVVKFIRWRP